MKTITSQFTHTAWNPSLSCRLLTQSENQILFSKLKLTRLGCKESFRYNLYIVQEMAYKLYFTSCINKLGLHCITYYMGMSQKDWKQTNSRIRSWPRSSLSHPDRHLNRSCCNSSPKKVTNKECEKIVLFVQSLYKAGLWTVIFVPFGLKTSDRREPAKCLSPRREANKIVYVFVPLLSCLAI